LFPIYKFRSQYANLVFFCNSQISMIRDYTLILVILNENCKALDIQSMYEAISHKGHLR
jgi:hypothetical protein